MMRVAWLWVGMVGCYTEGSWINHQASVACRRYAECDRAYFEDNWSNQGECRDDVLAFSEPTAECALDAGCEFVPEEAAACDKAMRSATCDEFMSGAFTTDCGAVYDCSAADVLDLAGCALLAL